MVIMRPLCQIGATARACWHGCVIPTGEVQAAELPATAVTPRRQAQPWCTALGHNAFVQAPLLFLLDQKPL